MRVADTYLGNVSEDDDLADRVETEDALTVTVDDTERRRSRVRTTADDGSDLGIVVARDLRAGDVLAAEDALVVVDLDGVEALVIDFAAVDGDAGAATTALALGHAVGNRHWDLAVHGDRAYLPVPDSRERVESEVRPHLPAGATVEYDEVSPSLFDENPATHAHGDGGHSHAHAGGGHSHANGDSSHSHAHAHDGHAHTVRELDPEGDSGDDATLASLRLADSSLPVGTDSVSYGLEQFVESGRVEDAAGLRALLATYLRQHLGRGDLVALRAAHEAATARDLDALAAADRRLSAVTLAAERRESSTRTGERLLALQRDLRTDDLLEAYAAAVDAGDVPGNHAVVLGLVAGLDGISADQACLVACHGFVSGQLGAAQRLLRLGHTDVQRTLDDLRPVMTDAVEESAARSLDEMTPFAPLVDVAAAAHERADRRLFLS